MAICLFFNLEIFSQNTFPASGNVGIGTTSPTETLQVIGSIKADTIVFPDGSIQTSAVTDSVQILKIGDHSVTITPHGIIRDDGDLLIQTNDTTIFFNGRTGTNDTVITSTNYNSIINYGNTGKVGIGLLNPSEKLSVNGTIESTNGGFKFPDGTVQTTAASNGGGSGNSFDTLSTNELRVNRIVPSPGDSLIHFGDSSVVVFDAWNSIFTNPSNNTFAFGTIKGFGIGIPAIAKGLSSFAVGTATMVESNADNSVVIGSGIVNPGFFNFTYLNNDQPNSLMVGFNSNIPTLFVSSSNGAKTTGNVGIGMSDPQHKLSVSDPTSNFVSMQLTNSVTGQAQTDGFCAGLFYGDVLFKNFEGGNFSFINSTGGNITTPVFIQGSNGNVGIGTTVPEAPLDVRGAQGINVGGHDFVFGKYDGRAQKNKTGNRALTHDGWQTGNDDLIINFDGDFEDGVRIQGSQVLIDGNVGIGTTDAYKMLTVNGDVSFANYNTSGSGNQGNGFSAFEILGGDDGTGTKIPVRRGITTDFDPNGSVNFYINSNQINSGFNFKNGVGATPTALMNINSVGDVGIKGQLTVNGHDFVLGNSDGRTQGTKPGQRALTHDGWQAGKDDLIINFDGDFEDGVQIQGPKVSIDGNVGIGIIPDPNYKLVVSGTIRACKVQVETLFGCDFVFDENYNLLPLKKRKEKVLPGRHLLNIAPAKEMQEKGVDLGETTLGILQIAEEHELYLYNHDERIEVLEKENKEQKVLIYKLIKDVDELKKQAKN